MQPDKRGGAALEGEGRGREVCNGRRWASRHARFVLIAGVEGVSTTQFGAERVSAQSGTLMDAADDEGGRGGWNLGRYPGAGG